MHASLSQRFEDLNQNVVKIAAVKDNAAKRANESLEMSTQYELRSHMYSKCLELFKTWMEDSVSKNIDSIAKLATSGLNHVIDDQELEFRVVQEQKNNRIHVGFELSQDGNSGDPLNSFGGGAAVVISLILRLSVMQRLKMSNLLILDESMVALANAYVPNAANFMKELSEKTGVNILMVTHNPEFLANSHISYEGSKTDSLSLKTLHRETL